MKNWDISFINQAFSLKQKDRIHLNDVPEILRRDLMNFIFGKTVTKREGDIVIFKKDYCDWLIKINTKGFDYDIQLKEKP